MNATIAHPATVLIADDDEPVRNGIVMYLQHRGFTVLEASDGEQALALYMSEKPDIVLCDVAMPGITGLDVLRKIRACSAQTPVLVISGVSVMDDVVMALRLGANDFITKPIMDLEVLEYTITRALAGARILRENENYRNRLERAIVKLEANLEILRADQAAGRKVQHKMLPKTPWKMGEYVLSHHISPSLYLSGDFVDYFAIGHHRFAFYLADVSGHGASSAFVTVLIKHMSIELKREYLKRRQDSPIYPSEVLSYINRSLIHTAIGKHVTVFGGVVDVRDNRLTYSFGGNFPMPVLCTASGCQWLEGSGVPAGLFPDAVYEDHTIDLPDCFYLSVFSDGILEVLPQSDLKTKEDCLLAASYRSGGDIHQLKQQLNLDALTQSGAPDDIALMILSRNAQQ